jgi:hypothetical protein
MSALVTSQAAEEIENALESGMGGELALDAEEARYTVALGKIDYLNRFAREGRFGFVT